MDLVYGFHVSNDRGQALNFESGLLNLSSSTDGFSSSPFFNRWFSSSLVFNRWFSSSLFFKRSFSYPLFFKRSFSSSLFFAALTVGCPVPACGNCQSWPVTRCRYASGLRRFPRSARVSSFTFDRAGKSAKSSQDDLYEFKLYKWGCRLVNFDSIRLIAYVLWIKWCFNAVLTHVN